MALSYPKHSRNTNMFTLKFHTQGTGNENYFVIIEGGGGVTEKEWVWLKNYGMKKNTVMKIT